MEKALISRRRLGRTLAASNLSRRAGRSLLLGSLVAMAAASLFSAAVLSLGLRSGVEGLRSRLGADLLVVPEGYARGAEGVLVSGEPCYFYMERGVLDAVRAVEGVERASAQLYLTSLSESCCDFPVQLVGFEPESDFVVRGWAREEISSGGGGGILLAGSNVVVSGGSVRFFGGGHDVSARLAPSGSGMDNVIFCDMASLSGIFRDAKARGFSFVSDGDTESRISTVLVRVADGASSEAVALRIRSAVKGVQVVVGERFVREFSGKISAFLAFSLAAAALVLAVAVVSLALSFSLSIGERRREFAVLRVLGAERRRLRSVLLHEAAALGSAGAAAGIFLSALAVVAFGPLASRAASLPFSPGGAAEVLAAAAAVFAVSVLSCVLASLAGASRLSEVEPYGEVK